MPLTLQDLKNYIFYGDHKRASFDVSFVSVRVYLNQLPKANENFTLLLDFMNSVLSEPKAHRQELLKAFYPQYYGSNVIAVAPVERAGLVASIWLTSLITKLYKETRATPILFAGLGLAVAFGLLERKNIIDEKHDEEAIVSAYDGAIPEWRAIHQRILDVTEVIKNRFQLKPARKTSTLFVKKRPWERTWPTEKTDRHDASSVDSFSIASSPG